MDAFVTREKKSSSKLTSSEELASSSSASCPIQSNARVLASDLGEHEPNQPHVAKLPITMYGSISRSFRTSWYSSRPWLEYSIMVNSCFCFPCRKFLNSNDRDAAFTRDGYKNWKSAMDSAKGFAKHTGSRAHLLAMSKWSEHKKFIERGGAIENVVESQMESNRYYLTRVFEVIKFLVGNELSFRGTNEEIGESSAGLFLRMIEYTLNIDDKFAQISKFIPQNAKYTSPKFQNEVITIMAELISEKNVKEIKSSGTGLFSVKCDETRDASGIELLSVVIRYVNKSGKPIENLLGLYELDRFDAKYITDKILGAIHELDLKFLLAQCYDGAAVMCGRHRGVQQRIGEAVQRNVPYIHCFNHQLHLVVVHLCQKVRPVQEFFDVCQMLNDFFSKPKVRAEHLKLGGAALYRLMEHRWTGHFKTASGIVKNFENIMNTLNFCINSTICDLSVTAVGLKNAISKPSFLFSASVMHEVLSILKPADAMLQSRTCSIVDGYQIVRGTIATLKKLRMDEKFVEIEERCQQQLESVIGEHPPCAPKRSRRAPSRLDSFDLAIPAIREENPLTSFYSEVVETVLSELQMRFSECNTKLVVAICALLPSSPDFLDLERMRPLCDLVGDTGTDFDLPLLVHEVEVFRNIINEKLPVTCVEERRMIDKFMAWFCEMILRKNLK